jgi:hypothetical protein
VIKPVFDPDVPARERRLMAGDPKLLHPASSPPPGPPRWGGRVATDTWFSLLSATVWGYVPALVGPFYGPVALVAGLALQAALIATWVLYGFAAAFLAGMAVQVVAFLIMLGLSGESPVSKPAREYHGRYLVDADFDSGAAKLLERTQTAVSAVLNSAVNKAGLLDDIANRVTLPRQEWDIAETLAEMTRLRREQEGVRRGRVTERITTMLDSHESAMRLATESLAERVSALEDYALRTMAADDAYVEWRTLQDLAEDSDAYRELLARTVRDRLAAGEIDAMTERARKVEDALRASVDDARRAGLVLLPVREAGQAGRSQGGPSLDTRAS